MIPFTSKSRMVPWLVGILLRVLAAVDRLLIDRRQIAAPVNQHGWSGRSTPLKPAIGMKKASWISYTPPPPFVAVTL